MTGENLIEQFPPQVLRQYAVIADGERGIVVGPRGDFCWMCLPRWDSAAVFSSLLGGMMTLIGTPPNILVNDILIDYGFEPLSLFDFAP